jgi:DNA excision repair protein ERCC-5
MIRKTPTSLEFSKLQINNLVHRNTMTLKLSDFTRNANIVNNPIAVSKKNSGKVIVNRVASERNRGYVLVKNDGEENSGGWTMKLQQVMDHAIRSTSNSNEFENGACESVHDMQGLSDDENQSIQIAIQKSLVQNRAAIPKNYESSHDEDDEDHVKTIKIMVNYHDDES